MQWQNEEWKMTVDFDTSMCLKWPGTMNWLNSKTLCLQTFVVSPPMSMLMTTFNPPAVRHQSDSHQILSWHNPIYESILVCDSEQKNVNFSCCSVRCALLGRFLFNLQWHWWTNTAQFFLICCQLIISDVLTEFVCCWGRFGSCSFRSGMSLLTNIGRHDAKDDEVWSWLSRKWKQWNEKTSSMKLNNSTEGNVSSDLWLTNVTFAWQKEQKEMFTICTWHQLFTSAIVWHESSHPLDSLTNVSAVLTMIQSTEPSSELKLFLVSCVHGT